MWPDLRYVAGNTPVELFLMLSGVLVTCYIAALCYWALVSQHGLSSAASWGFVDLELEA
jgi:hypothetical protein